MKSLIVGFLLSSAVVLSTAALVHAETCSDLSRRITEIQTAYGAAFSPSRLTLSQQRLWNEWELRCQAPPQEVSCQDLVKPMRDVKAHLSAIPYTLGALTSAEQRIEILWRDHCQGASWRDQLAQEIRDHPLPYYPRQAGCHSYSTAESSTLVCVGTPGGVRTSECYTNASGGITCTSSGH
jgi:hypothetical protein